MTITGSTRQQLRQRAAERGVSLDTYIQDLLRLEDTISSAQQINPPDPDVRLRAQDAVPAGITLADARLPDVPLVYANQAFLEITGYTQDDITGRNCRFLQADDRQQPALDTVREAIQNETECQVLLRNYRKDGSMFWNELMLTPLYDDNGTLTHFVGIQMDVTERVELRQNLLKREQHLQTLFQKNPLPMWVYDLQTLAILDVNQAAIRQYGYSRDAFLSMTIADLRPDSELPRLQANLQQEREAYQQSGIWMHKRSNGTRLDAEVTSHVIDFEDRQAALVVAVDVTHRLEAERQLARSEKRYRMVSELSFDYAFSLRIHPDGSTEEEWVTDAFQQVTGYTPDESEARGGWATLIHPDDLAHAMQILEHTIRSGEGSSLDYRIITKSGEVRHIHGEHIPERDPDSGQVIRIYGVAHDITEQQNALQQLRRSEERFRRSLEAASEGILLVGMEGDILLANEQASAIFGHDRETLTSLSALDLLPIAVSDLHKGHDAPGTIRRVGDRLDLHARRADGKRFPIQINLSYIEDDGEVRALCLIEDITVRKQLESQRLYTKTLQIELEKERELMELKQRFISMISHEFRTPLTVMLSSSQILERYHNRLSMDRFLKHVKSFRPQIERMTHMLDEVLLVNKADANLLDFNPHPVEIHHLLPDVISKARLIDDYRHNITLKIADDVPAHLSMDPTLLEHILMNLLSNATKYSPEDKQVVLDVRQDSTTDELVFHVKDAGMGIPLDDQKRLFQPFHRAKNVQHINGTGLGLAIVQNSAELHGGRVSFTSQVDEGSIFTVRLPLESVDSTASNSGNPSIQSTEAEADR